MYCSHLYSHFIKGKFDIKTEDTNYTEVKEEPFKIIELKIP